jgi:hypothetical protein
MRPVVRAAMLVLLLPVLAGAASAVDGNWAGRADSPDKDAPPLLLMLKTDNNQLTGSIANGPAPMTLENGTASETAIVFDAVQRLDSGATALAFSCSGTLKDDAIDLTCQVAGGGGEKKFHLTRQAKA